MTAPRKTIVDDLDLGVTGQMSIGSGGKRKAANSRQREKAAEEEEHEQRRVAIMENVWGRQRTGR